MWQMFVCGSSFKLSDAIVRASRTNRSVSRGLEILPANIAMRPGIPAAMHDSPATSAHETEDFVGRSLQPEENAIFFDSAKCSRPTGALRREEGLLIQRYFLKFLELGKSWAIKVKVLLAIPARYRRIGASAHRKPRWLPHSGQRCNAIFSEAMLGSTCLPLRSS
jgi:hypothetical protein